MWSRVPTDVKKLILTEAAKDSACVLAMACVSREWLGFMADKEINPDNHLKPSLCQAIRVVINTCTRNRDSQVVKKLKSLFVKDSSLVTLQRLLAYTANHFKTMTYQQLPMMKGGQLSTLTPSKLDSLKKLGKLELYMLYLVEQGFLNKEPIVEACINTLEKLVAAQCKGLKKDKEKFNALQVLIVESSGMEKAIYITACNLLSVEGCIAEMKPTQP